MNKNQGFIRYIILIVIFLLILSFFNVSLRGLVFSEAFQDNWNFIADLLQQAWAFIISIWSVYLSPWLSHIWDNILLPLYLWIKGYLS